jgi:TolB-like protein/DNA-binding winged helix-turn-helix (wHTH) protein/tetratricopeptide (TPR) repeat protein
VSGSSPQPRVSFGAFEVNPATGDLRKSGIHVKLHDKPFQILLALLERPGEVVTRKELQERLWPQDTFGEFENGLNNAIGRLREALGDTADTPRYIETVPRRGYRFVAEVISSSWKPRSAISGRWLIAAGCALAAVIAVFVFLWHGRAQALPIRSIAVLPFRDLGTGKQDDFFAAGMTDAVTTELAKLGVSKVTSETSVEKFEDTKESVPQIARALGVDGVVEGAVLQEGNQVRITVQLIRADTDKHVWAESYVRQMTDILALQHDVALGVAQAIDLKLSPGTAANAASAKLVNPDAYKDYLMGQYFLQERTDQFLHAKEYFEKSIQLDPSFAPAYAGLSQYYWLSDTLPPKEATSRAKEYAEEALRLDPDLPEGHLDLAAMYFYFDWNWAAADLEFKRAIALAPALARAHLWYAKYLGAMGRKTDAMAEAQRALDLDPLSIPSHDDVAVVASYLGKYDQALEQCHQILELDPNNPVPYVDLSFIYIQKGMYNEALAATGKALALTHRDPHLLAMAAFVQTRMGKMEEANKLMEELKVDSRNRYVSPVDFAVGFAGLDKRKEAVDALAEGLKNRNADMVSLNSNPFFESLHSDPRFQDLLRKMNFPASPSATRQAVGGSQSATD